VKPGIHGIQKVSKGYPSQHATERRVGKERRERRRREDTSKSIKAYSQTTHTAYDTFI